jgi:hypothetical protein
MKRNAQEDQGAGLRLIADEEVKRPFEDSI